jgi:hypothetical protein
MTNVPLSTAGTLPITGASIYFAPFSAAAFASSCPIAGPVVLISTIVLPAAASKTPSGPK